jgi:NDP-sugar pyrophosphorylase family protein
MKALILAAEEGSRLHPGTAYRPTPMPYLGGKPLLEEIVSLLKRHGISDIAVSLHYKPWTIVQHLGHGRDWGVKIHYSFEEKPLGSAGAAKQLEWYFDESFLVYYGDVYTDMDLSGLIAAHRQGDALATMALCTVDDTCGAEIIELDPQSQVQHLVKDLAPDQVDPRFANGGVLVIEPEILSGLPADRYLDFEHDVFPRMLAAGQSIIGHPVTDTLMRINTPENYQKAQQMAMQRAAGRAQPDLTSQVVAPTIHNLFQHFAVVHSD